MERRRKTPALRHVIIFAAVILGVIIIFNLIRQSRIVPFLAPQVTYDASLTEEEKATLEAYFKDHAPSSDLTISAKTLTEFDRGSTSSVLYTVYLPVTGFYNPITDATLAELQDATKTHSAADIAPTSTDVYLLSADQLDQTVKLLSLDGSYFLDTITNNNSKLSGAIFRVFDISSDSQDAAKKAAEALNFFVSLPTADNLLTFTQTGVTALTRQMQTKLNATGDASLFSAKIADFLSSADITHTSNEVSFATDCTSISSTAFCADYRMFKVLEDSGIDIMELTGNHNNDWGADANITTIDFYHDKGIQTVGGGKTEDEAKIPLDISEKGNSIALIAVNESTSTKANGQGASGDHPGANIYDEDAVKAQIKAVKDAGDFVIVDIQYFECYSYPDDGEEMPACDLPISGQEEFFKSLADAGADMIVGTQAHQPQTYELYGNVPIYYGLGNLFFDQIQWPGTRRSLVLTHYFADGKLLQTKITPTMYDTNFQTEIMDSASATAFLSRLMSYN